MSPTTVVVLLAVAATASASLPTGELVEGLPCLSDPTQTYSLYLPRDYGSQPERRWPALLVLDTRGRSAHAAERFITPAEEHGWIVLSSDNSQSDSAMEPNIQAINALWFELEDRFSVDSRRVYLAGFSGTANISWITASSTGKIAGVIASGGRFRPNFFAEEITFATFGAAGTLDFNYLGMREVDAFLGGRTARHRLELFDGRHTWLPPELAELAVLWMEVQAMRDQLRPIDPELVGRLYARDLSAARELESSGDLVAAMGRYRAAAESVQGLVDVSEAERAADRLSSSREVKRVLKEEQRWDRWERDYVQRLVAAIAPLREASQSTSATRLERELEVATLLRQASGQGYGAAAARRGLEHIAVSVGYYLTRDLLREGRYERAAEALRVASEACGDRPHIWYNLACALANSGQQGEAVKALERAVELGYSDLEYLRSDADLAPLRGLDGYRAIELRLAANE